MLSHEIYMHRCLELAAKSAGKVAPNPMVGAVLVYSGRIIGEGYHEKFGEAHAEVNCIDDAIRNGFADVISSSVLYVSLEPCSHFGKTPPCTDLIIRYKIPEVIIGSRDTFEAVNGKGIERLQSLGVKVTVNVLGKSCREINKRFFTFQERKRPYIILKWAETANGKISGNSSERLLISNDYTNRLVHKWRSEEAAILVGTNTALYDNPQLNTRLWPGGELPVRIVLDMNLRLPASLHVFDRRQKTIIINSIKENEEENIKYLKIEEVDRVAQQISDILYKMNVQSVLVEGGAMLLQTFNAADLWDEIRVIQSSQVVLTEGLSAPQLPGNIAETAQIKLLTDRVVFYLRNE